MGEAATTKLSSKGRVVIPEEIRNRLGPETGAQFVIVGDGDVVILKVIQTPDMAEFNAWVGGPDGSRCPGGGARPGRT